jgi:glycosidase
MNNERKVLSVGDYLGEREKNVIFSLPSPEGEVDVELLIRRPTVEDSMKLMEFMSMHRDELNDLYTVNLDSGTEEEKLQMIKNLTKEQLYNMFKLVFLMEALTISSSVYTPKRDGEKPKKVFDSYEDV